MHNTVEQKEDNHTEYLKKLDHLILLHKKIAVTKYINWLIAKITEPNTNFPEISKTAKELLDVVFDESEFKKEQEKC